MNPRSILRHALCALLLATGLASRAAAPESPTGGVAAAPPVAALGAYIGPGCNGGKRLAAYEAWLGRPVDQVLDALSTHSWKEMEGSALWAAGCWSRSERTLVLSVPMLPNDRQSTFEAGARGDYDDTFRAIARVMVKRGYATSVIRIGWEFNAGWFPWSALKQPAAYVAHWRRIVEVMRSVPGADFRFDWCPVVVAGVASPEAAYPGDDVVDIVGADVYNQNWDPQVVTAEQRWQRLLDAPFGLKWHRRFAAAHGKPMSYPEWGTGTRPDGHGGGDDAYFVRQMAAWIAANPVVYHNYWDYPAKDYNGHLSDHSKPAAEAAFLTAFGARPHVKP